MPDPARSLTLRAAARLLTQLPLVVALLSPLPVTAQEGAASASPAGHSAELTGRLGEIYADGSIQDRLPGHDAAAGAVAADRRQERVLRIPAASGGGLLAPIGWTIAAVVLVLVLLWLGDALLQRRRLAEPALAAPGRPSRGGAATAPGTDAAALAGAGRYSEAVHTLLLQAIDHIAARAPGTVSPASTAREIARKSRLEAAARQAFERLLSAGERFLFGGQALDREDYADCLAAYGELDRSLTAPPAAAGSGSIPGEPVSEAPDPQAPAPPRNVR